MRAVLNALGDPVFRREFLIPPTRNGLLRYLGISAEAWRELAGSELFRDTVNAAEERLADWRIEQILSLPGKDIKGLLFDLEQNYPVAPPAERREDAPHVLSMEEKRRRLRELFAEIREEDRHD